jgi:hypothetical protein
MVLLIKEYFPISILCLLFLIFRSQTTLLRQSGRCNLSSIAFHARSPEYTLNRAHIRDILCCDNVSQFDSFVWYANLTTFLCTLSNACICPALYRSQHAAIQEMDVLVSCRLNFWYYYSPLWVCTLWNVVPSRPFSPCSWHDQPSLSHCVRLFPSICNYLLPELIDHLMYNTGGMEEKLHEV